MPGPRRRCRRRGRTLGRTLAFPRRGYSGCASERGVCRVGRATVRGLRRPGATRRSLRRAARRPPRARVRVPEPHCPCYISYILDKRTNGRSPCSPETLGSCHLLLCAQLIQAVSFSGHGLVRRLHDHVLSTFLFTALGHERQLRYGFNEETVII